MYSLYVNSDEAHADADWEGSKATPRSKHKHKNWENKNTHSKKVRSSIDYDRQEFSTVFPSPLPVSSVQFHFKWSGSQQHPDMRSEIHFFNLNFID